MGVVGVVGRMKRVRMQSYLKSSLVSEYLTSE
jgi:hypothetical protein